MTILQTLLKSSAKAVAAPVAPARTKQSPIDKARAKFLTALGEQMQLLDNPELVKTKKATRKEDGQKVRKEVHIKVKSWVSVAPDERPILSLRCGNSPLELSPGKSALHITKGDVKSVLAELIKATKAGELDAQLGAIAQSAKAKFKKAAGSKK